MISRVDMEKRIFTFWEPKEAMPAYIRLCMRTWAKVLPDYEVVLLDHGSLGEWFDFGDLRPVLDSMPLSQQSDAIGAALLVKYGGLWLDADTILLSDCVQDAFHVPANFVQFGAHCALAASRKNGLIARAWWREAERNLRFKHDCERWQDGLGCLRLRVKYLLSYARRHEHLHRWDYLANFSLSSGWSSLPVRVTKKIHSLFGIREYASLDRATARPEMAFVRRLAPTLLPDAALGDAKTERRLRQCAMQLYFWRYWKLPTWQVFRRISLKRALFGRQSLKLWLSVVPYYCVLKLIDGRPSLVAAFLRCSAENNRKQV